MLLTAEQLKAISPGTPLERCQTFVPHINKYCPQYGIDTPIELASWLSQVLHESGGFKWLKEIWGPNKWQVKYEGRVDLGNTVPGDGKKFMGRGIMQITGRKNYTAMSKELFGDNRLLTNPDILCTPEYAVQSACVYWKWRNMDRFDDDFDITKETKLVNGGYNGLADRKKYFEKACEVFGLKK